MSWGKSKKSSRHHSYFEEAQLSDFESLDDNVYVKKNNCFYLRLLLSFVNVLILFLGISAIGVGVWSSFIFYKTTTLFGSNNYNLICLFSIILGLFVFFCIFFIGCMSTLNDKSCCLNLYSFSLLVVFLVTSALCLMTLKYKIMVRKDLNRHLHNAFSLRSQSQIRSAFDVLQRKFKCCGLNMYVDWLEEQNATNQLVTEKIFGVPESCCITETENCGFRHHPSNIYYEGCGRPLESMIQFQLNIIAFGSFIIACIQLMAIFLSCYLIKKSQEVVPVSHYNSRREY